MAGVATLTDAAQVRALNGAFRQSLIGGRVIVTSGVAALPCLPWECVVETSGVATPREADRITVLLAVHRSFPSLQGGAGWR